MIENTQSQRENFSDFICTFVMLVVEFSYLLSNSQREAFFDIEKLEAIFFVTLFFYND